MGKIKQDVWIQRVKKIHGDKYDYSKTIYNGGCNIVTITCPIHGDFTQKANKHLYHGHGCPKCGIESRATKRTLTTDEFINKSKKVHGDKYDYSKTRYKSSREHVCITCPTHGDFYMSPNHHLGGQGCKECNPLNNAHECKLLRELRDAFRNEEIIHQYYNTKIFGRKSIDIYFPNRKIGIEYQGNQHFIPVEYYGGKKYFGIVRRRDEDKLKECIENGITLLYYTYDKKASIDDFIGTVYTNFDDLCKKIIEIIG